jgi:hypothetical protein
MVAAKTAVLNAATIPMRRETVRLAIDRVAFKAESPLRALSGLRNPEKQAAVL